MYRIVLIVNLEVWDPKLDMGNIGRLLDRAYELQPWKRGSAPS